MNWWKNVKSTVESWLGHLAEETEMEFGSSGPSCCGTGVVSCCGTDAKKGGES